MTYLSYFYKNDNIDKAKLKNPNNQKLRNKETHEIIIFQSIILFTTPRIYKFSFFYLATLFFLMLSFLFCNKC